MILLDLIMIHKFLFSNFILYFIMSIINGPLNVVRLEGKINNIKKVIYVFFDIHMDIDNQTKCDDFKAIDVVTYFAKEFKNISSDKEIDFFMEGRTTEFELFTKDLYFKDKYIAEVVKFFAINFKKNTFENVRFHYIDIRDFFTDEIDRMYKINSNLLDNLTQSSYRMIDQIISNFKAIQKYHENIIEIMKKNGNNKDNTMSKYIIKLNEKYNNKEIKEKIKLFKNIIIEELEKQNIIIDELIEILTEFQKKALESFDEFGRRKLVEIEDENENENENVPTYFMDDRKYMRELEDKYKRLSQLNLQTFSLIMDSYFMRRFCDKDYITHAISYTGGAHSMAYVNFLCNQFDFKITHIAKSTESIDELNKKLKDKFNYLKFSKYFFPKTLLQCVNLSDFPEKFN
jgi:hypothetical protein